MSKVKTTTQHDNVKKLKRPPSQPSRRPRRKRGFLRTLLLTFLSAFAFIGALAMGFVAAEIYQTSRNIDEALNNPISALVKQFGLAATPEVRPDPIVIINDITQMAKLQTAEMTLTEIFTGSMGTDTFLGLFDDNLLFVAVGTVTAGVDLSKLTANDIEVSSFETATVRLPATEIFIATIDNSKSQVINRQTGLLTQPDPQLETIVRQAAVEQFNAVALDEDILSKAQIGAEDAIYSLLTSVGFQNVLFIDETEPLPAPYPDPELPKGYVITPIP